mmetsp:Transcript_23979/g.71922  ORF Transcript_23979/g.71922 Transcript_23979/m.71922 type:complete len:104 (+) Transcript_23979:92-403(+)
MLLSRQPWVSSHVPQHSKPLLTTCSIASGAAIWKSSMTRVDDNEKKDNIDQKYVTCSNSNRDRAARSRTSSQGVLTEQAKIILDAYRIMVSKLDSWASQSVPQ